MSEKSAENLQHNNIENGNTPVNFGNLAMGMAAILMPKFEA